MKLSSLFLATIFAVVVLAVLLLILGVNFQRPLPARGAALYNSASEVVVKGVVQEVQDFGCPVSEGEIGRHLMLMTAQGVVVVHLAPARVMRSQKLTFAPGDQIEVLGSRVRLHRANDLIAREITRGNESFVFRDDEGRLMVQ